MQCPRCQHKNPADAAFCQECGSRLEVPCPGCGTANQLGAKFCKKCGQPVAMTFPAAAVKFPSPESYTPRHLAEKILTSKRALEGERKQVTVLFADLKGSMELLADRDPEEARKILDPVLERMMEAVHRYEGTVNQVMGDGIMALFGAPMAHEEHAVRACYAALRMQESVKRYAEEARRTHEVNVRIRVGLNSGEVGILLCAGMIYLAAGRIDEAAGRAREALALTRRLGARASEAHALCLAGDIASAAGADDAERFYREALTLAVELGMRPLVAHCHLGLGKLYQRTGKRDPAQEHLTTATTMYRETGMTYWLEKADAEIRRCLERFSIPG